MNLVQCSIMKTGSYLNNYQVKRMNLPERRNKNYNGVFTPLEHTILYVVEAPSQDGVRRYLREKILREKILHSITIFHSELSLKDLYVFLIRPHHQDTPK